MYAFKRLGGKETMRTELDFLKDIRKDYFSDLSAVTDSISTKNFLEEIRMRLDSRITALIENLEEKKSE